MADESNADDRYEVVIRIEGGYGQEHAELLKDKMVREGYHDHVVGVRPTDDEVPAGEADR